jgi:hypothetical protein
VGGRAGRTGLGCGRRRTPNLAGSVPCRSSGG